MVESDADDAMVAAIVDIARVHLGFTTLTRQNIDELDFRDLAVWSVKSALEAAFAAGQAGGAAAPRRAPDCATARAASIAGIIAAAVMAGEMNLGQDFTPTSVETRIPGPKVGPAFAADLLEGARVAGLMISARARASVRTPTHAAMSGAEAALAAAEDALATRPTQHGAAADAYTALASIRDTLRAGLHPGRMPEDDRSSTSRTLAVPPAPQGPAPSRTSER